MMSNQTEYILVSMRCGLQLKAIAAMGVDNYGRLVYAIFSY